MTDEDTKARATDQTVEPAPERAAPQSGESVPQPPDAHPSAGRRPLFGH